MFDFHLYSFHWLNHNEAVLGKLITLYIGMADFQINENGGLYSCDDYAKARYNYLIVAVWITIRLDIKLIKQK